MKVVVKSLRRVFINNSFFLTSSGVIPTIFAVHKSGTQTISFSSKTQLRGRPGAAALSPSSELGSAMPLKTDESGSGNPVSVRTNQFFRSESPLMDTALNDKMYTEGIPDSRITREDKGLIYKKSISFITKKTELSGKIRSHFAKENKESVGNDKSAKRFSSLPHREFAKRTTKTEKGIAAPSFHRIVSRSTSLRKYKSRRHDRKRKRVFVPQDDDKESEEISTQEVGQNSLSPYSLPVNRDRSEHGMLARLLDQNAMGFGTKQEKQDKEFTIREIEKYTDASSRLPPGFTVPTQSLSDFTDASNLDVSIGTTSENDEKAQDQDSHNDYRKSSIPRHASIRPHKMTKLNAKNRKYDKGSSKNGAQFKHLRSHSSKHGSAKSYKRNGFSMYEKLSRYPEFPKISSAFPISKFSLAGHFPRNLPFSGAESFKHYKHFQPFQGFDRNANIEDEDEEEDNTEIRPPPPLPPTLISREHTSQREAVPRDEAQPIDEPAPIREPAPIPEIAPIPELPSIKEIPPISENREPQPKPLDPKKTFEKAESNGGVKKSLNKQ